MKEIKKEKLIEIFTYILFFSVFMGSNFCKFNIFHTNFNIARVLMIVAAIIAIASIIKSLIKKEKLIDFKNKHIRYCAIYFICWSIYSIISIYKALDLKMYLITNFFISIGTLLIIYFLKVVNIDKIKNKLFDLMNIAVVINCIYYLYLFFVKNKNIGGFYHNSNDLGTVLLLTIPITIYLMLNEKEKKKKIIYCFILLLYTICFKNITSRGAILGLFFSIFVFIFIKLIKNKDKIFSEKKNRILACILIILALFFAYNLANKYIGRINFTPIPNPTRSNDIRINLIYNGMHFLKQDRNFFFGIGSGNAIYYLKNFSIYSTAKIYNFHNLWLDLIVEYGIIFFIGFIIMCVFVAIELYKNHKKDKLSKYILFFWFSLAIACISSSTLLTREWLWLTFAVIISYINLKKNDLDIINTKEKQAKNKKNVIFVTILPLWSMNKGSGGKAFFSTVEAYANSGYNVFLVTNQNNDYSKLKNINNDNIYYIDQTWYKNSNTLLGKLKTLVYYYEFEKKSYDKLNNILVNLDAENTIIYAYEVAAVKSCKKASTMHNVRLVTRFQGTIMANVPSTLYYKLRKYPHIQALSTRADLVIMTDDGTQGDQVLNDYKNHSKRLFIRNGVNVLDKKTPKINKEQLKKQLEVPKEAIMLLTVSRLEGWKKVERSIFAFNELKIKEKYRLIIVGEGAERSNLEELVKSLNLTEYIKFLGAIKNEKVQKYMIISDIFLSFYDLSNVGNPLLEALCLGKPIITYNVGDTHKIIDGKNGMILDDVSAKNIAKNIELMSKKQNLQEFSQKALEYAKQNLYSWKHRMELELAEVDKLFEFGEQDEKNN